MRCRVDLQERLDGELVVLYEGTIIARQPRQSDAPLRARRRGYELVADPPRPKQRPEERADVDLPPDVLIPVAKRHPWRTYQNLPT